MSIRQVQAACEAGRIESVVRKGRMWLVQKNATKPIDGRTKGARQNKLQAESNVNNTKEN